MLFEDLDLSIICGGRRNFKTALLVAMIYEAYLEGYEIYTNISLERAFFEMKGKGKVFRLDNKSPEKCLKQIQALEDRIDKEKSYQVKRLVAIDELKDIIPAQDWESVSWSSKLWTQGNKVGLTLIGTLQSFNMVYNHYRDLANKKIITVKIDGTTKYLVFVFRQSPHDYKAYSSSGSVKVVDASEIFSFYNTHERLY